MKIDEKRLAEIRVEHCDDCGWRGHDELVSAEIGWWPTCGHPRAEPPEGHAFLPILRDDDDPAPPEGCPLRNGSNTGDLTRASHGATPKLARSFGAWLPRCER